MKRAEKAVHSKEIMTDPKDSKRIQGNPQPTTKEGEAASTKLGQQIIKVGSLSKNSVIQLMQTPKMTTK